MRDRRGKQIAAPSSELGRFLLPNTRGRFLSQFSLVLGSHAGLGLLGLASLPFIARNLGTETYGRFSLFMTLSAVIWALDLVRPLLVHRYANQRDGDGDGLQFLAVANVWFCGLMAALLGFWLIGTEGGLALSAIAVAQSIAGPAYAMGALRERIGVLHGARNALWGASYVATAALSMWLKDELAFALPFAVAGVATSVIWLSNGAGARIPRPWALPSPRGIDRNLVRDGMSVHIFNVTTAAVSSLDKVWMRLSIDAKELGQYLAQSDLALKMNLLGTALGNVLYPSLSRQVAEEGAESVAPRFARVFASVMLGYGVLILALMIMGRSIVAWFFGDAYLSMHPIYSIILIGTYLQMIGFLLTPWQRARGEFALSRNAYLASLGIMVIVGAFAVPAFGMLGGAVVYLAGRTADIALLAMEWRQLWKSTYVRWSAPVTGGLLVAMSAAAFNVADIQGMPWNP